MRAGDLRSRWDERMRGLGGGYMTLEASFIVPWVVFIVVWLMYVGYFEYDRCLLFQDDYTLATQTAARITDNESKQSWLNGMILERFGNKYMGTRNINASGEVSSSKVTVESSLTVSHPLSFHAGMIPSVGWSMSDRVSADNFSYTKRLRLFRAAGRVLGGG